MPQHVSEGPDFVPRLIRHDFHITPVDNLLLVTSDVIRMKLTAKEGDLYSAPIDNRGPFMKAKTQAPLHELPALKGQNIITPKLEPLPVLALGLESLVPVRFDSRRVVSPYRVDSAQFLGHLNRQLIFASPRSLAPSDLVETPRFHQIHEPKRRLVRFNPILG
jgi:hypothetical protein